MRNAIQVLLSGVLLCAGSLFHATSVDARSVPGIAAQTLVDCIDFDSFGAITNRCSSTKKVVFPLPIQNYGNKIIDVWAFTNWAIHSLKCQATMIDNDGSVGQTSWVSMPAVNTWDNIPLSINVESTGALTVHCEFEGSNRVKIGTIYYDE